MARQREFRSTIAKAYALTDQSGATIHLFEIQMAVQNRNFLFARCD
jgi:hypothetical protein